MHLLTNLTKSRPLLLHDRIKWPSKNCQGMNLDKLKNVGYMHPLQAALYSQPWYLALVGSVQEFRTRWGLWSIRNQKYYA